MFVVRRFGFRTGELNFGGTSETSWPNETHQFISPRPPGAVSTAVCRAVSRPAHLRASITRSSGAAVAGSFDNRPYPWTVPTTTHRGRQGRHTTPHPRQTSATPPPDRARCPPVASRRWGVAGWYRMGAASIKSTTTRRWWWLLQLPASLLGFDLHQITRTTWDPRISRRDQLLSWLKDSLILPSQ